MAEVSRQAGTVIALALACLVAACSIGAPSTLTVSGASVDSTYTCPSGSDNAAYDIYGTVDVRNGTSSAVTIESVAAVMTLTAIHGSWLESPGSTYDPGTVTFTPTSVPAGSSTPLKLTIRSACTSGTGPSTSYGDYSVALTIAASTGTYKVTSGNRHRIVAA